MYRIGRVVAGYAGKGGYHKSAMGDVEDAVAASGFRVLAKRCIPLRGFACLFTIAAYGLASGNARDARALSGPRTDDVPAK